MTEPPFTYFDALANSGITGHFGGPAMTRRLLDSCHIAPGQRVLDLGCGTGYTACLLAKQYQAQVVAIDVTPGVLDWAKKRIEKERVGDRVTTMEANAQELPFTDQCFDAVIAESVLIFTDAKKVAAEAYRVLKPHGVFGDNEMTPRQPLPAHLLALVMSGVALSLLTEEERRAVFQKAGFAEVTSHVFPIDVLEVSLLTPLRTDGLRRYVWALVQQLFDPRLKALMPPLAFKQIFQMFSYLGYGLYVARKM